MPSGGVAGHRLCYGPCVNMICYFEWGVLALALLCSLILAAIVVRVITRGIVAYHPQRRKSPSADGMPMRAKTFFASF
jgi:hypothetical protein